VGEADFEAEVLRAEVPVVVDFYATWCGPCKAMAPALVRLAEAYTGRVRFVKVDVDKEAGLASKFGATAVPTLVFFKAGAPAETIIGASDERTLRSRLEQLVSTGQQR
jgi:thioredoxin 1